VLKRQDGLINVSVHFVPTHLLAVNSVLLHFPLADGQLVHAVCNDHRDGAFLLRTVVLFDRFRNLPFIQQPGLLYCLLVVLAGQFVVSHSELNRRYIVVANAGHDVVVLLENSARVSKVNHGQRIRLLHKAVCLKVLVLDKLIENHF
jgi:hypothetical protein